MSVVLYTVATFLRRGHLPKELRDGRVGCTATRRTALGAEGKEGKDRHSEGNRQVP